jgi:uncharacterized membrane protein YphA (DoxX/SURF4 family)
MKYYIRAGRIFYAIGIAGLGIQQFIYSDFRPVILPEWPAWIHGSPIVAYLSGLALIIAGILILLNRKAGTVSLLLGGFLLVLFIVFHTPYLLFIIPYSFHLGSWTDALKELALSGGAFVMAGSFVREDLPDNSKNYLMRMLEKIIPAGKIFFSITMIAFGIDHFLYTEFVATLVPAWIPGPVFWTYFAAIALIGSGVAIILKIRLKTVGLLLGTMLLLWFIILHIPRAIADPHTANGNEITSVFEALAFSGIAFVIAGTVKKK